MLPLKYSLILGLILPFCCAVNGMAGDGSDAANTQSIGQTNGSRGIAPTNNQTDKGTEPKMAGGNLIGQLLTFSRKFISPPLSPNSKQKSPNSTDQPTKFPIGTGDGIPLTNYWESVQKFFDKRKTNGTQKFVRVPPEAIAKIIVRMINAFVDYKRDKKDTTISADFALNPQNFMVHPKREFKSDDGQPFNEDELAGNVNIAYCQLKSNIFESSYEFLYKSPQQIITANINEGTEEADFVWAFGVILYEFLTGGKNPFEGLRGQLVGANDPNKGIGIQSLSLHYAFYVDDENKKWGGDRTLLENLQKAVASLTERGEEVPIPYGQTLPSELAFCADEGYVCVNEYEELNTLTKQCLQTYKKNRITMEELLEKLKEIAREK